MKVVRTTIEFPVDVYKALYALVLDGKHTSLRDATLYAVNKMLEEIGEKEIKRLMRKYKSALDKIDERASVVDRKVIRDARRV